MKVTQSHLQRRTTLTSSHTMEPRTSRPLIQVPGHIPQKRIFRHLRPGYTRSGCGVVDPEQATGR
jgi:hypothetical protein